MSENASEETTIDGEIINHFEKHGIDEFKELDNYGIIDGIVRSLDDKDNPLKFSNTRKWIVIVVLFLTAFLVTVASSAVPFTYPQVIEEYQISDSVATLGLSLFVIGLGFAPLVLAPLSEFFGRRPIYLGGLTAFFLATILVAQAKNVTGWLIGRLLQGVAGSAFLSVAGGSVVDLFNTSRVAAAMATYSMAPFLGPSFGPIIAGFINQNLYWRWTWWIMLIWTAVTISLLYFLVPETFAPALLLQKAKRLRKEGIEVKAPMEVDGRKMSQVILMNCAVPFQLAMEPMAFLLCLATALLLGILYMMFSAFSIIYAAHGFTMQQTGLAFLGQSIGVVLGTFSHPFWQSYYTKIAISTGKPPPPEEHLRRGVVGAFLIPASLFWFAFTVAPSIHWSVSVVATIPFGIGTIYCFSSVFIFLVSTYRPVAASAMGLNSAMRSGMAAGFPLFTAAMFSKLGTTGALALCAGLCTIFFPMPFLYFFKYGAKLRAGSKFAI